MKKIKDFSRPFSVFKHKVQLKFATVSVHITCNVTASVAFKNGHKLTHLVIHTLQFPKYLLMPDA